MKGNKFQNFAKKIKSNLKKGLKFFANKIHSSTKIVNAFFVSSFNKIRNIKLTKNSRLSIFGFTILSIIVGIVTGSVLFVSTNSRKSIEYGGGAEYIMSVKPNSSSVSAKDIATTVANEIYERVNADGIKSADAQPEILGDEAQVRVTLSGIKDESTLEYYKSLISEKPHLVFTDIYGNPLFMSDGRFRSSLSSNPGRIIIDPDTFDWDNETKVPLASSGAKSVFQNGSYKVQLNIEPSLSAEWTKATTYISSLQSPNNVVLTWLNIPKLINLLKTTTDISTTKSIWETAGRDLYKAIHIDNDTSKPYRFETVKNIDQYMVSKAEVKQALSGTSVVIEGSFSKSDTLSLSRQINYGASNYNLSLISSKFIGAAYGSNAFQKALIAGIIVFALIAIFLIYNYGVLGIISTISIGFYLFITLSVFTALKGEYSPEAIASIIIGIGMSVDANIITFERLKSDVYSGLSIQKSNSNSNRKSFATIFDANITTLIVAIVLFYLGSRNIIGMSITLMLSIVFTLLIMLGLTRMLSTLLVNTNIFDNKKHLIGIKKSFDTKIQTKIDKYDYIKSSKWFSIGSISIIGVGIIVFAILAGINQSVKSGFTLSQEFTGGTIIDINKEDIKNLPYQEAVIRQSLSTYMSVDEINRLLSDGTFSTQSVLPINNILDDVVKTGGVNKETFTISITSTNLAKKLLQDAIIALSIAFALITIYILFRFKWTYAIPTIIALVHDALFVLAMFVFTRVEISPVFVAALLSVIGYSVNDTIVTFDRVREKMKEQKIEKLDALTIKQIANSAIRDTLKRSILTSLTTILAVVVLMSFGNATKLSFNLVLLFGLVSGTYSSIFIATYLWTKFELMSVKMKTRRMSGNFWKTDKVEEQIFAGMNDFSQ